MSDTTSVIPPPAPAPPVGPRLKWTDLLLGLPALLIALGLVGTLMAKRRGLALEVAYRNHALEGFRTNNMNSALIDFKRLTYLQPMSPDYRLALAMVLERLGFADRAESLGRSLAPPGDSALFPAADLWLAQRLVADPRGSQARLQAAEMHIRRFLRNQPNVPLARLLLVELLIKRNRPREARPLLEPLASGNPELLINLANLCKGLGDVEESHRRANQAIEIAGKNAKANAADIKSRVLWANALVALDDYEGAIGVLNDGLIGLKSGNPPKGLDAKQVEAAERIYREVLGLTCSNWHDAVLRSGKSKPDQLQAILERGLAYNLASASLVSRLADLTQVQGVDSGRIFDRLKPLLGDAKIGPLVHFTLGNDAWRKGKEAEARKEWEGALTKEGFLPLAANNLAWSLAFTEPKDLGKALSLIEKALSVAPEDPRLRATRGQVLTQLGRWKDSVPELESALAAGQTSSKVRAALGDAYEHLNLPDKAAEQRKLAIQ